MKDRTESSQRPYWQDQPCPSWCGGHHRDADHPADRTHYSYWEGDVVLTLAEPHTRWTKQDGKDVEIADPAELQVYVLQDVRETAPRVQLSPFLVDHRGLEIDMTVDEARKLARKLAKAIRLAESA